MTFLYYTLLTLLLTVAILLILLILIQKGRGGGLSSAFGGGGGSTAFGAKTGDVLTWATSIVFGVFILLAVALDLVVGSQYKSPSSTPTVASTPAAPVTINPEPSPTTAPTTPVLSDMDKKVQDMINAAKATSQAAATQATGALKTATKP
jgi:preprotein translocase subunit SecG